MRQQRRKNAQTAYSQFPVFPQVFSNYTIAKSGADKVTITNAFGIIALGIPQLLRNDTDFPTAVTQVNDNEIELTYGTAIGVDDVIEVPNWCPGIRGFNGEYFAPRQWHVNSNLPTAEVIWISASSVTGANTSLITFSENVTILALPNWQLDDGNTMVTAVPGFTPDQIDVTWTNPVTAFANFLLVPVAETEVQGVSGRFVAPAVFFVL